ncbi:hypothetical protein BDN71DRAFT_1435630 [Pleurotus eryngii]|uniref:Uncharacterized protein n=1 Tax=Pleurotus eryngii TaxID=5323 RepID=A0A9P5ZM33_PLEER|nr:hypothetical protein BDN71DRAFT_1435630 [Pleurotus eryngii]
MVGNLSPKVVFPRKLEKLVFFTASTSHCERRKETLFPDSNSDSGAHRHKWYSGVHINLPPKSPDFFLLKDIQLAYNCLEGHKRKIYNPLPEEATDVQKAIQVKCLQALSESLDHSQETLDIALEKVPKATEPGMNVGDSSQEMDVGDHPDIVSQLKDVQKQLAFWNKHLLVDNSSSSKGMSQFIDLQRSGLNMKVEKEGSSENQSTTLKYLMQWWKEKP